MRGGAWFEFVGSGVFAFSTQCRRTHSVHDLGVRAAFIYWLINFGDRQKLPLRGGCWYDSERAGVFAFTVECRRSPVLHNLGVRAASLFSQIYPAYGLGISTMRKKGLSPAF